MPGTGVVKCPQCGLVTFDNLPQCPRCKESFALVRPLASASVDGARHVLRDDPEVRLRLRDRLHRARLDRRKQNENPLAAGTDPDAPDWFAPEEGADSDSAEPGVAVASATSRRSKEAEIVNSSDLSHDEDARGGTTTADVEEETGIIEASREPDDDAEPDFDGEIPGFADWREELRERLKRIRAKREQERLAAEAAEAAESTPEATEADPKEPAAAESAAATEAADASPAGALAAETTEGSIAEAAAGEAETTVEDTAAATAEADAVAGGADSVVEVASESATGRAIEAPDVVSATDQAVDEPDETVDATIIVGARSGTEEESEPDDEIATLPLSTADEEAKAGEAAESSDSSSEPDDVATLDEDEANVAEAWPPADEDDDELSAAAALTDTEEAPAGKKRSWLTRASEFRSRFGRKATPEPVADTAPSLGIAASAGGPETGAETESSPQGTATTAGDLIAQIVDGASTEHSLAEAITDARPESTGSADNTSDEDVASAGLPAAVLEIDDAIDLTHEQVSDAAVDFELEGPTDGEAVAAASTEADETTDDPALEDAAVETVEDLVLGVEGALTDEGTDENAAAAEAPTDAAEETAEAVEDPTATTQETAEAAEVTAADDEEGASTDAHSDEEEVASTDADSEEEGVASADADGEEEGVASADADGKEDVAREVEGLAAREDSGDADLSADPEEAGETVSEGPRPTFSWGAEPGEVLPETDLEATVPTAAALAAEAYDARRRDALGEEEPPAGEDERAAASVVGGADTDDLEADDAEADDAEAGDAEAGDVEAGDVEPEDVEADEEEAVAALADEDAVPELDFEAETVQEAGPLDLEVPAAAKEADRDFQWDADAPAEQPKTASSSGPLGERAAAALCDLLVLTAIGAALVGAAASGTGLPFRQVLADNAFLLFVTWSIFAVGYSVFLVGACGQTIGRMVMRLRVVGDEQFSVGFDRAAIRLAAWVVSALPLLAGMLPALRDPQLRGLHDRLSRTRVVKA